MRVYATFAKEFMPHQNQKLYTFGIYYFLSYKDHPFVQPSLPPAPRSSGIDVTSQTGHDDKNQQSILIESTLGNTYLHAVVSKSRY